MKIFSVGGNISISEPLVWMILYARFLSLSAFGSNDPLYLVLTLKTYLDRTSNVKAGSLFIHHSKQTALSKVQIRTTLFMRVYE